ncbi:hypothetical protein VNO77_26956 [Canavalia gladiata]|uniref:Uncharacterized protein n=1 Tax=Canavalia gladiata TaxID=3824 RepID=A0AAN9KW21_CANGL
MEPAKIDWKRLEWNFVEDELYENINAPKWVDFSSLDSYLKNHDDEAWFCKPDCKHPKTAEDFLRSTTPSKKTFSPGYVSENLPFGDQNRRDMKIKRRVPPLSSASPQGDKFRFNQDSENQNPNLCTPTIKPLKPMKATIKSSEEKKPVDDDTLQDQKVVPLLRSTLSAKNLFAGRPILNQITEFCNELKKLAIRARERENAENLSSMESEEIVEKTPFSVQALAESEKKEKGRKPLLEVTKAERLEGMCVKGKQHIKKRPDEAENMPITIDLENLKHKREGNLQLIRTNPPSPQCFSAARGSNKTTLSKASKSRLMERGILEEIEQNKEVVKESSAEKSRSIAIVDGRETKAVDMFWFLKPCTLSS